jgi:serine/threonine protein kinase
VKLKKMPGRSFEPSDGLYAPSDGSFVPTDPDLGNNAATSLISIETEINAKQVILNKSSNQPEENYEDYYISHAQTDIKKAETIDQDNRVINRQESEAIIEKNEKRKIIDSNSLEKLKILGEGANGIIYLCRLNDKLVAVKEEIGTREVKNDKVQKEFKKLADLDHENIIRVIGISPSVEKCDSIVMEYAETSLESLLRDTRQALVDANYTPVKIPDSICLKMILQLASAMKEAHSKGHIHADLSSKNVLIKKRPSDFLVLNEIVLKIIDFSDEKYTLGTLNYIAPEIVLEGIEKKLDIPEKARDVYSFGVLCWEILTLETPFKEIKNMDYAQKAFYFIDFHKTKRLNFNDYPGCSKVITNIISRCFNTAKCRPTFDDLFEKLEKLKSEYPEAYSSNACSSRSSNMNNSYELVLSNPDEVNCNIEKNSKIEYDGQHHSQPEQITNRANSNVEINPQVENTTSFDKLKIPYTLFQVVKKSI